MKALRVLIVDDHVLFRKGLAALLQARAKVEVVGEANDGFEAISQARELVPDLIFMDLAMPRCSGLEATRIIKSELPHVHIVILTVSDDDSSLFTAIMSGAEGYLLKIMEPEQLYDVLDGAQQGAIPIPGVLAARILQEFRQPEIKTSCPPETCDQLTQREIEVLEQVVEGASNKEIADYLHITENTVKIHLCNILEKLHLKNRIQAAVFAVRQGLVPNNTTSQSLSK